VTISDVTGSVQVLARQEGKQGWIPVTAGSELAGNAVIRVDNGTGGEIGVGDTETAQSIDWIKIHSGPGHTLYQMRTRVQCQNLYLNQGHTEGCNAGAYTSAGKSDGRNAGAYTSAGKSEGCNAGAYTSTRDTEGCNAGAHSSA